MRVTQRDLARYRNAVDEQADLARAYVSSALEAYFAQNPGASTADGREFAIALLETALPNFADAAGTLAADFFDEMMEAEGIDAVSELYDTTDYSVVEDKVRFFADRLNDGDQEAFKRQVVDATHYFVKRSAYDNMIRNCSANDVRYARVPSGFETCGFCFMLSSRGFVYESEETAKGKHGYHAHCDCCIVPGKKGRTVIDGYDPKGMAERWEACAKAIGTYDQAAVLKEVESRDWEWLYTGTCRNTRLAANPDAKWFKENMPEVYGAWQESVSRICGERRRPPGLKLSQEQRSHIFGTTHYNRRLEPDPNDPGRMRGPSYFTDENGRPWPADDDLEATLDWIWELIRNQAGRGVPRLNRQNVEWNGEEIIDCGTIIGVDGWSGAKVSWVAMRFGFSSVHMYPSFGQVGK